ncbi:hypothetical protein N8J89_37885 [Crossiella sp. CA-258035]|uniref:hypothetical protein n=1 Tax=Crossiella sp. CA-258035 TaxID=2981138 RepID=UPI0024BD3AB5|nr:hypothetical protein [Crossiella sp. CA-258035]WHT18815.1 hypothetical protein N8J89_37885 [Crossiella sp. CA-258035]
MADLIRQQPCPVRIPPREVVETEEFVDELLGEETTVTVAPPQPLERTRRSTRLIGMLIGAVVLTGAVTAASAITSNIWTTPQAERAPVQRATELTGAMVLRPDLLTAELVSPRTSQQGQAASASPVPPAARVNPPVSEQAQPLAVRPGKPVVTTQPGGQRSATTQPPAQGLNTPVGVVREFYQRLGQKQPETAAGLLTPNLLGDLAAFIRSWSELRQLDLKEVEVRSDGSVLAVVRLQQADGSWLTVEQLLRLANAVPMRITGAELLSAQRG